MKNVVKKAKKANRPRQFQDTRDQLWKLAIENHWDDFLRFFFPKWFGCILPTHIINQKNDNIRLALCADKVTPEATDKKYFFHW